MTPWVAGEVDAAVMYLTPPHERESWDSWSGRNRLWTGRFGRRARRGRALGALRLLSGSGPRNRGEDLRKARERRRVAGPGRRRPRRAGRGDVSRRGHRRGDLREGRAVE